MMPWDEAFDMLVKRVFNFIYQEDNGTEEIEPFFCCPVCNQSYYKSDEEEFEDIDGIPVCKRCGEQMI